MGTSYTHTSGACIPDNPHRVSVETWVPRWLPHHYSKSRMTQTLLMSAVSHPTETWHLVPRGDRYSYVSTFQIPVWSSIPVSVNMRPH